MVIRWISMVFHLPRSEWTKGRLDLLYRQKEWQVRQALAAEIRIFKGSVATLRELQRLAAQAMLDVPIAKQSVAQLLWERMDALRATVHDAATGDTEAA